MEDLQRGRVATRKSVFSVIGWIFFVIVSAVYSVIFVYKVGSREEDYPHALLFILLIALPFCVISILIADLRMIKEKYRQIETQASYKKHYFLITPAFLSMLALLLYNIYWVSERSSRDIVKSCV